MCPDVRATVSDRCQRPAPRHQLYRTEPGEAERLPGSYKQGILIQYALSQNVLPTAQGQAPDSCPNFQVTQGSSEALRKRLTPSLQYNGQEFGPVAQWDELCGGPTSSTLQDQDSVSPQASSQLISGSQVGIQVTPVSGVVTPQWPATYWTFCLQPYFQLIHFLIYHVLLSPGSSRLIGKYLVCEGIVMIL